MESVWDYPRPPRVEPVAVRARVLLGGAVVADSTRALRVLETSQAPAIYFPSADVAVDRLTRAGRRSLCEWKGQAVYYDVDGVFDSAWSYPDPVPAYAELRDHVAFYPQHMGACFLGDERVDPNQGDFYGGWITSDLEGPFKGGPGTLGW
jgi:uncharacterized protein (DUF427 family)